jgi:hypothetical protein
MATERCSFCGKATLCGTILAAGADFILLRRWFCRTCRPKAEQWSQTRIGEYKARRALGHQPPLSMAEADAPWSPS